MISILVNATSSRLTYVLDWVFMERMGIAYQLFTNVDAWMNSDGYKLAYGEEKVPQADLFIKSNGILFETELVSYPPQIQRWKHSTIIFYNQPSGKVPFDIFGAIFWMLTRYEEYISKSKDIHNRFPAAASIAAQYNFLQQPVIDEWIINLAQLFQRSGVVTNIFSSFQFVPTYDIDIAYAYQEKGLLQNVLGGIKDVLRMKPQLLSQRFGTMWRQEKDAYDNFDFLEQLRISYHLKPLYFWLLPKLNGTFDRNVDRNNSRQLALIEKLKAHNLIGIHPSYQSHQSEALLAEEIGFLSNKIAGSVTHSRQHYIKISWPDTYRHLIQQGITDDYSMGYADANGFRAGTSQSFYWFDLLKNESTKLRVHPFCFMEATAIFYNKHQASKAYDDWERMYYALKKVNGTMITIFHNYTLGKVYPFKAWSDMYQKMLATIHQS